MGGTHLLVALMSMLWILHIRAESDDVEVDQALVEELLAGVARLPEKTPVRVAAEKRWGSATEYRDED
jgi:hypothetical protein